MSRRKENYNVEVPGEIVDKVKTVANQLNFLWDPVCPFRSLYIWLMIFMVVYYTAWVPDTFYEIHDDNKSLKATTVTPKDRVYLVLSILFGGFVGSRIIQEGCNRVGPLWAILWFLVALMIPTFFSQIALAFAEKSTLPSALVLLDAINKSTPLPTI